MGRARFNEEKAERYLNAVRAGAPAATAAMHAGVSVDDVEAWRARRSKFRAAVAEERAHAAMGAAIALRREAKDNWRVAERQMLRIQQSVELDRLRELMGVSGAV